MSTFWDHAQQKPARLLPIHLGARIASAGILGIQIRGHVCLDRRSASTHPNVSLILLDLSASSG